MKKTHPTRMLAYFIIGVPLLVFQLNYLPITATSTDKTTPPTGGKAEVIQSIKPIRLEVQPKTNPTEPPNQNKILYLDLRNDQYKIESVDLNLLNFVDQVENGQADLVRGVYVEGVLSLPVIQQPEGDSTFVSLEENIATQFRSAARKGVTGILAHNFLAGIQFYNLEVDQEVNIVYGDGDIRRYRITRTESFQKLSPDSLHSDYVDLATNQKMTTKEVFNRFYSGGDRVTFQTCLERDGRSNWGLIFVVAEPIET